MQRNIINQKYLNIFIYLPLFLVYESLTSIYLLLPPMFGILFVIFINAIKNEDTLTLMVTSIALVFFEAQKDYILFSSIVYFTLIYKLFIIKIDKYVQCSNCISLIIVVLAYIGYYIFSIFIAEIFLLHKPDIDFYILYYIGVEFFILLIFQDWRPKHV